MLTAGLAMADSGDRELKKHKPFHDFLGVSLMAGSDSPIGDAAAAGTRFPSASDLGSEIRNTMHLEGVPFHGFRSDVSGPHMTSKSAGSKRINSDSAHTSQDGFDRLHSVKMYRGGSGTEQLRRLSNEDIALRSTALQPTSLPQTLPHQTHNKTDGYSVKWDRALTMNVPRNSPYPAYISPCVHQVPQKIFRDAAAGSSVISHVAADEGSRNGIKGSGVWNSMKSSLASDEFHPNSGEHILELSGAVVTGRKLKPVAHLSDPEAPIPGDKQTKSSDTSRQMTIFYDGHAHVFDDVLPNKAEVIMALAGSNAASWSSTLSAKSSMRLVKEGSTPTGEIEIGTASNTDLARDQQGKPSSLATAGADPSSRGTKRPESSHAEKRTSINL